MNISFIEDEKKDYIIVFLKSSYRFFRAKRIVKDILNSYMSGKSLESISKELKVNLSECENVINKVNNILENEKNIKPNDNLQIPKNVLQKLIINVTEKCNLKCKYCYEQIENACAQNNNISFETIDRIFDVINQEYNDIKFIQFFGGEAFLNIDAIEYTCEKIESLYKNNVLLSRPVFGLVSNGTIMNDKIINVLKKYNIDVTISFDGTPKIHDKLRVFKDDSGSSDIIINNIKKLKTSYNIPLNFEVTYNNEHVKENVKFVDIIKYLQHDFGLKSIHITPVLADKDKSFYLNDLSEFEDSIEDLFNDKEITVYPNKVNSMLMSLTKKTCSPFFCTAGLTQLSVATNGDIYPCFMLVGVDKYKMGSVYDYNVLKTEQFAAVLNSLKEHKKCKNKKCTNCHMINLCSSCLGVNYFSNNSAFNPDDTTCSVNKNMLKKILFNICDKTQKLNIPEVRNGTSI